MDASSGVGIYFPSGNLIGFYSGDLVQSLSFCVLFCRSLFGTSSIFYLSLYCLSFALRVLINHWHLQTFLSFFVAFLTLHLVSLCMCILYV